MSRRGFLRAVPAAAAVSFVSFDTVMAEGQAAAPPAPFQMFTAESLAGSLQALQGAPGNKNLVDPKGIPVAVVMTTEVEKSAAEFEWHEGRDHIVQILDGTTVYEVGGAPKDGRNVKPGEWLAPTSAGSTRYEMKKGDMLLIPRGTPHKRSTATKVTLLLISPMGSLKA